MAVEQAVVAFQSMVAAPLGEVVVAGHGDVPVAEHLHHIAQANRVQPRQLARPSWRDHQQAGARAGSQGPSVIFGGSRTLCANSRNRRVLLEDDQ